MQIPKFDAKPNPNPKSNHNPNPSSNPNSNPNPSRMPIRFGQMTLQTSELLPQNMQQGVTRESLQHGCNTGRLSVVMTRETGCTPLGRFNVVNVTL